MASFTPPHDRPHLAWLDSWRGLAMIWILLFHYLGDIDRARVSAANAVLHLGHHGYWAALLVMSGRQGVDLFIVLSGLGIAYAYDHEPIRRWWRRHIRHILVPYYLAVGVTFLWLIFLALGRAVHNNSTLGHELIFGQQIFSSPYRVTVSQFFSSLLIFPRLLKLDWEAAPPTPSWFIALLLQFYLLAPWLIGQMKRWGRGRFLTASLLVTLLWRWLLFLVPSPQLQSLWSEILAPSRLFEFCLGLSLVPIVTSSVRRWAWVFWPVGLVAWLLGTLFFDVHSLFPLAAPLIGLGVTTLTFPLAQATAGWPWLRWIGRHSLEIFLIHEVVRLAVNSWPFRETFLLLGAWGFVLYFGAIVLAGILFTRLNTWVSQRVFVTKTGK